MDELCIDLELFEDKNEEDVTQGEVYALCASDIYMQDMPGR